MKNYVIILILLVNFIGCSHIEKAMNNITPSGGDTYTLTYSGKNLAAVRTIVYKAANQFCQSQDKAFLPIDSQLIDRHRYVELVFRCLDPNDPEFIRLNWGTDR